MSLRVAIAMLAFTLPAGAIAQAGQDEWFTLDFTQPNNGRTELLLVPFEAPLIIEPGA